MGNVVAVWNGTKEDLALLGRAIARNCVCDPEHNNVCPPHQMLADQDVLNRLAFGAILRTRLMREITEAYDAYNAETGLTVSFVRSQEDERGSN